MSKIRKRLKAAYENVVFYSNSTWVNISHMYQRANQELYARERKIEETLSKVSARARSVRDRIPNSKLATYSDYEYNESRELCYASDITDISFYYPCTYKRDSIKEPWMLPEVEQLFIWLAYSCDFDLLDPMGLEELNHLDEQEKADCELKQNCCSIEVFHQVNPLLYKSLERTPGKPRYTKEQYVSEEDLNLLPVFSVKQLDNVAIRILVQSERIRSLWEVSGVCMDNLAEEDSDVEVPPRKRREKFNIFKSPLGNYFVFDNVRNVRNIPNLIRIEFAAGGSQTSNEMSDLENLEHLANSFFSLKSWIMNEDAKQKSAGSLREDGEQGKLQSPHQPQIHLHHSPSQATPPERRSYSAVLQGLCPNKNQINPLDVDHKQSHAFSKLAPLPFPCAPATPLTALPCDTPSCQLEQPKSPKASYEFKPNQYAGAARVYPTPADTWPKASEPLPNAHNVQMGNYSSYTLTYCPYVNNFGTLQYCNSLYKSYGNNCALSSYSNSCCGNYYRNLNQMPRQGFAPSNPLHISPPLLLLHQQRTQAYYSNCIPQPLVYLPQSSAARSSQRWTPFLKPTSSLSYHVPVNTPQTQQQPPHWTSTQIPTTYTRTTNSNVTSARARSASKKPPTSPTSLQRDDKSRRSSCSSLSLSASEENLAVKASASSPSLGAAEKTPSTTSYAEPETHPLTASVSVDLERQAMEQYRSSNENFYRQLRLAASEQENQGNWPGPPNDSPFFGGLSGGRLTSVVARNLQGLATRTRTCDFWGDCCKKLSLI